jgi:hypothetical protein
MRPTAGDYCCNFVALGLRVSTEKITARIKPPAAPTMKSGKTNAIKKYVPLLEMSS